MSVRYIHRILEDQKYYIDDCCNKTDLLKIHSDIETARKELKELEQRLTVRYQEVDRMLEYNEVIYKKHKPYKGNIEILVYVNTFKTIDGVRQPKNEMIYGTHKKFTWAERKIAEKYSIELSNKYNKCKIIINK